MSVEYSLPGVGVFRSDYAEIPRSSEQRLRIIFAFLNRRVVWPVGLWLLNRECNRLENAMDTVDSATHNAYLRYKCAREGALSDMRGLSPEYQNRQLAKMNREWQQHAMQNMSNVFSNNPYIGNAQQQYAQMIMADLSNQQTLRP